MADSLLNSTLAGMAASIVEPFVTYPLEYLKVREQLAIRPQNLKERFSIPEYTRVCYSGCSAFVLGNSLKAFTRFQTYNWAAKFMADGKENSAPQVVVAGIITGVAESLLVVPFENIKTAMIESSAIGRGKALGVLPVPGSAASVAFQTQIASKGRERPSSDKAVSRAVRPSERPDVRPKAQNLLYTVKEIKGLRANVKFMYENRGLRAFVQGFTPTIIRQVTNSSVRFTSYNFLKQLASPDGPIGLTMAVGLAGASSLIEAAVTQPIDVVKTRMQSTNGIKLYGNAMMCSLRIFMEEGPKRLWAGLLPRWLRIWSSGGIMFIVYEQSSRVLNHETRQKPFE